MPDGASPRRGIDIAIIGLAGRFPKAADIDAFWSNLCAGVEALSHFTLGELVEEGVDAELASDPNYVPVNGRLDGADLFDASFFGYTARDALIMDPQHRHFLECSWEALENAGYGDPPPETGVFAGVSVSTYLLNRLVTRPGLLEGFADIETTLGNDKDFLASRVAYKLDLNGPAVVVQSACSSSLVAVHLACTAIAAGDCDMALAGGASIDVPQRAGYLYKPEGIYSSDGHCRPFDARADGMIGGSGAGVVVLKPLDRAIRDRDTVHAVIRGSAINNDGANKVGYSAPSVEAQARVIARAQRNAGVDSDSIGYVEAHGTGTALGDPIEVAALTEAFATERRGFCALGAVKSNVGHLNAAAGITGLIKAALVVRHGRIPPMIHFETPNPHLDLDNSPFFVNRELLDWPASGAPRRAGVSSFGMGGTNAHVILEEPPSLTAEERHGGPRLLTLSARTPKALEAMRERLAAALDSAEAPELDDVAFTLQFGRRRFEHRAAVVCDSLAGGVARLRGSAAVISGVAREQSPETAFLFPGQGSQHPGMARELYEGRAVVRREIDRCCEVLDPLLGVDLRSLLLAEAADPRAAEIMQQTAITQSALFTVQYALAALWASVGVEPVALIGHSIGEYTAACVSGVFGLEDALRLVAERGRLLQELPTGAMMAVSLPERETEAHLIEGVGIAAVNDPHTTVVSGPHEAIDELERRLRSVGTSAHRLRTSHAFHSPMMRPAAEALRDAVAKLELGTPRVPFVSNVSGTWITGKSATDPQYWADHLIRPVRFMDGLGALLERRAGILLEVGPGTTLTTLARRHPRRSGARRIVSTLPHPQKPKSSEESFLEAVGKLWTAGVEMRWENLHDDRLSRRVPLPTYPFEGQRFWIDAPAEPRGRAAATSRPQRLGPDEWCYAPSWRRAPELAPQPAAAGEDVIPLLLFEDGGPAEGGGRRAELLGAGDAARYQAVEVRPGSSFRRVDDACFEIDPWDETHYDRLLESLRLGGELRIVHRWAAGSPAGSATPLRSRGFDSLLLLARAVGRRGQRADWLVVTEGAHEVTGEEMLDPDQALVVGACRVIPFEYEGHRCRNVDLAGPDPPGAPRLDLLSRELAFTDDAVVVAFRGGHRWLPSPTPLALPPAAGAELLRDGLRAVVTGGTRGVGAALAEALAGRCRCRIALLSRTAAPAGAGAGSEVCGELERLGSEVMTVAADVADPKALGAALDRVRAAWGGIDLIVHAAGVAGGGAIELKSVRDAHAVMAPKVEGTRNLWRATRDEPPALFVLCSSLASEIGGYGQIDYCAANAFQDAFALAAGGATRVLAIDWETWSETGMAVDTEVPPELRAARDEGLRLGLRTREGQELFLRLLEGRMLAGAERRVLVSTRPLEPRLRAAGAEAEGSRTAAGGEEQDDLAAARPELSTDYDAPRPGLESDIADIWRRLFGVDRVGRHDDFFELGGHSLLATQLLNRLRKVPSVPSLSMADLFEHPTIAQLVESISAAAVRDEGPGLPGRSELAALDDASRLAWLTGYLEERLEPAAAADAGEEGSARAGFDAAAATTRLVWDLRRDLDLSVYPHELRHARSVGELAEIVSGILAGRAPEPPPVTRAEGVAPAAALSGSTPAPAPDDDPLTDPIVFLLSAPRSGSTLLRLMLAGHPSLFCPPELALLSAGGMREWHGQQHGIFARDGITHALMELRGVDEREARAELAELVAADRPVKEVFRRLQRDAGARVLLDKSPAYLLDPAALARAEALFDGARYLLLTRHPVAVIESLVRHRMEALLAPGPIDDPWSFAEQVWVRANRNLLDLEAAHGDRCLRVRYEHLVRDPEGVSRRIAEFLDLPFDPGLLHPYAGGRMIDGPGDPDIFQHDGIDASLAEAWRSVELPRALEARTLEVAEALGYVGGELAGAGNGPSPGAGAGQAVPRDPRDATLLLDRLNDLSDDEVEATLSALLGEEADG